MNEELRERLAKAIRTVWMIPHLVPDASNYESSVLRLLGDIATGLGIGLAPKDSAKAVHESEQRAAELLASEGVGEREADAWAPHDVSGMLRRNAACGLSRDQKYPTDLPVYFGTPPSHPAPEPEREEHALSQLASELERLEHALNTVVYLAAFATPRCTTLCEPSCGRHNPVVLERTVHSDSHKAIRQAASTIRQLSRDLEEARGALQRAPRPLTSLTRFHAEYSDWWHGERHRALSPQTESPDLMKAKVTMPTTEPSGAEENDA